MELDGVKTKEVDPPAIAIASSPYKIHQIFDLLPWIEIRLTLYKSP